MSKKPLVIISLVILAGLVLLVFQNSQKSSQLKQRINTAQNSAQTSQGFALAVDIRGYAFKPDVIKVKKGTTITWTNKDPTKHTVSSEEGNYLDSQLINKGQTYQKTFDTVGTYKYHCKPHPDMIAVVIVVD